MLSSLKASVAAAPNIEVLVDSTLTGRYDDNWVAVVQEATVGQPRDSSRPAQKCWSLLQA